MLYSTNLKLVLLHCFTPHQHHVEWNSKSFSYVKEKLRISFTQQVHTHIFKYVLKCFQSFLHKAQAQHNIYISQPAQGNFYKIIIHNNLRRFWCFPSKAAQTNMQSTNSWVFQKCNYAPCRDCKQAAASHFSPWTLQCATKFLTTGCPCALIGRSLWCAN